MSTPSQSGLYHGPLPRAQLPCEPTGMERDCPWSKVPKSETEQAEVPSPHGCQRCLPALSSLWAARAATWTARSARCRSRPGQARSADPRLQGGATEPPGGRAASRSRPRRRSGPVTLAVPNSLMPMEKPSLRQVAEMERRPRARSGAEPTQPRPS